VKRFLTTSVWTVLPLVFALMLAFLFQLIPIIQELDDIEPRNLVESPAGRAQLAARTTMISYVLGAILAAMTFVLWRNEGPGSSTARRNRWAVAVSAAVGIIVISGGIVSERRYVAGLPPLIPDGNKYTSHRAEAPGSPTEVPKGQR
jgi:hypothetical protein